MQDLIITSIETISAFDITTGAYRFTLDELQNCTLAQTQDKEDITGKQGRKLSSLKRNKAVTISGNNGLVSAGLLELQTGGEFENKVATVKWMEIMDIASNATATTYTAIGTAGNEIDTIYVRNSDGTLGTAYTQAATAGEDTFAYDPSTKAITFAEGALADGVQVVAWYNRHIQADVLTNMSDTYSEKAELFVDAFAEDKCANIFRVQIHIPKADFNGEFSIEFGENQTVHAFEAEALSGACGTAGEYFDFIVFGANAEDAA